MDSLESELRRTELLEGREINLSDSYKELIKRLHDIGPLVISTETNPTRAKCQEIIRELVDFRLRLFPEFEKKIKGIKQARIVNNFNKRKLRSDKQTEQIMSNFNKNINLKTKNHE